MEQTAMQFVMNWIKSNSGSYDSAESFCAAIERQEKWFIGIEKNRIIKAVNDTIDAYHQYVESPHSAPPMNGSDYYEKTYSK
jgi:hypothetical protein